MNVTDRIVKSVLLKAPRSRVWRALTDAREFGAWFRVQLDSGFAPGEQVTGQITYPGCEHLKFVALVERMDAETCFSLRWCPYALDPDEDYSGEPTTLVEFRLEETGEGTRLTISESGFDQIPAERREESFRRNSEGWDAQVENIRNHVGG